MAAQEMICSAEMMLPGGISADGVIQLTWIVIYGEVGAASNKKLEDFKVWKTSDGMLAIGCNDAKRLARVMTALAEKSYTTWTKERLAKATEIVLLDTLGRI